MQIFEILYLKGRRGEEERKRKGGERGGRGRQLGGEIERGGKVGERDDLSSQSYNLVVEHKLHVWE